MAELHNLTIDTAGTEKDAEDGLEAAIGMEVEEYRRS